MNQDRYEVLTGRVDGADVGDLITLDPARVNIPGLIEAGHVRLHEEPPAKPSAKSKKTEEGQG